MRRWPAPSRSAMPPRSRRGSGASPTDGELYMAHFFGTGGAGQLINAARDNPHANAAGAVSRRGARQQVDLLRPAGQRAQRRRRLCRAQPPLSGGARQRHSGCRADRGRSQHARRRPRTKRRTAASAAQVPDTAGHRPARSPSRPRGRSRRAPSRRSGRCFRMTGVAATGAARSSPIVSELWSTPTSSPTAPRPNACADRDRPGGDGAGRAGAARSRSATCGRTCAASSEATAARELRVVSRPMGAAIWRLTNHQSFQRFMVNGLLNIAAVQ